MVKIRFYFYRILHIRLPRKTTFYTFQILFYIKNRVLPVNRFWLELNFILIGSSVFDYIGILVFICLNWMENKLPRSRSLKTLKRLKSVKTTEISESKIRTLIKVGCDLSVQKFSDLNSDHDSTRVKSVWLHFNQSR